MPDAIDMFRAQMGGGGPPPPTAPPQDPIAALRASLGANVDVSQLPEFAEKGLNIGSATGPNLPLKSGAMAALKAFTTDEPERLATMLKDIPGITVGRGKDNQPFVEVEGKKFQLNRPGISIQDVTNFLPQAAGQVLLSRLGKFIPGLGGTGVVGSTAREAIAGGVGTGGKEAAEQALAGEPTDPLATGVESVVGFAGGLVGNLLGSGFANLFKRGAKFLVSGQLTKTAREALKSIGVDPGTLDRKTLEAADTILRKQVGGRATPEEMAQAVAKADTAETGVPLTKGQATGSFPQQAAEVKLAEGIRGGPGQETMRAFRTKQDEQIANAAEATALRQTPGMRPVSEEETGSIVRNTLIRNRAEADDAVDTAYTLASQNATKSGAKVSSDFSSVKDEFDPDNFGMLGLNEKIAPRAYGIFNDIQKRFGKITDKAREASGIKDKEQLKDVFGELSPQDLEGLRKAIGKAARETKDETDRAAIIELRRRFDDYVVNEVGPQDPSVVPLYESARNLFAETEKRFGAESAQDVGGKLIEKAVSPEEAITNQGVVDKIFGAGDTINPEGQRYYGKVVKALGGTDTPGGQALRQSMVRRAVLGTADRQAVGEISPERISKQISKALEGKGAAYISQTLGPETLRDLQVLQRQMDRLVRDKGLRNPPRSGFLNEAAMRAIGRLGIAGLFGGAGGAAGFMTGGPIAALAGAAAGGASKYALDKGSAALGKRAAEKAIKEAPILGPIGRIGAKGRVAAPVTQTVGGLLPPLGAPSAESLFETYLPYK